MPKWRCPGEPLQMTITASRPTQAVVYAVDEGILQVARYTLPDPLGYFFRKQALEVGTRQTVDLILPEYSIVKELAAAGGDADDDALAHHLNPFKRKHDAPVAYWSGIVDLGPQAKTFTYNVPDYFAGTIRVMVVANTADAVGSAETKLQVRGPFVISPNVPTFVAPGDTFDVSVTIANNVEGSGANAPVNLDLQATEGLEVTQKPELRRDDSRGTRRELPLAAACEGSFGQRRHHGDGGERRKEIEPRLALERPPARALPDHADHRLF